MVMLLITLFTPLTSVASLVTSVFSAAFESIVDPVNPGKASDGFLRQGLVARFVDLPGQGDNTIPGFGFDGITLKIEFVCV
jgi:hypothetical protein